MVSRNMFSGKFSTGVELYHSLMVNSLGGRIAYFGAACDSNYGFGVLATMARTLTSLGAKLVWYAVVGCMNWDTTLVLGILMTLVITTLLLIVVLTDTTIFRCFQ